MRNISVEENAYDFYKQNLSFGKRYEVKLPLQTICESLPDNYSIAKSRLVGLQKQLNLNPGLCENYDAIIKTYLNENITEKVNVETAVVADIQQAFLQITSQKLTEIFFNLYCFRTLIIQMLLKHYVLLVLCLALRVRSFFVERYNKSAC